jgi:ethanolaminephosphotransferase
MLIHRVVRYWNQTGDKWLGSPDYVKWLETHYLILWVFSTVSIFLSTLWILDWIQKQGKSPTFQKIGCLIISCLCIIITLFKWELFGSTSQQVILPTASFYLLLGLLTWGFWGFISSQFEHLSEFMKFFLVLLSFLLHRFHNFPLLFFFLLEIRLLEFIFHSISLPKWMCVFLFLFWGESSYFALGNSNGFATIDLGTAYIGMSSYNELLVGVLLITALSSGPLLFFLASLKHLNPANISAASFAKILWTWKLANFTWLSFLVILMSNHLFIWTVFTPKWMYSLLWRVIQTAQIIYLFAIS